MNQQKPAKSLMTWRILCVSLLMVATTFGLFLWERLHGADIDTARTVAVNTLVVAEVFYLFNTRYLTASTRNREDLLGSSRPASTPWHIVSESRTGAETHSRSQTACRQLPSETGAAKYR